MLRSSEVPEGFSPWYVSEFLLNLNLLLLGLSMRVPEKSFLSSGREGVRMTKLVLMFRVFIGK